VTSMLLRTIGTLNRELTVADELLVDALPEETKQIINELAGDDDHGLRAQVWELKEEIRRLKRLM
jgi:hypothetical protein